jgi:hypothetical protein
MRVALLGANDASCTTLANALQGTLPALHITTACALMQLAQSAPPHHATLLKSATARHRQAFDLTLLLAPASDAASALDLRLRDWLQQSALPYASIFGGAAVQTANARDAIQHQAQASQAVPHATSLWHWNCENCSDATCEYRLFSAVPRPT